MAVGIVEAYIPCAAPPVFVAAMDVESNVQTVVGREAHIVALAYIVQTCVILFVILMKGGARCIWEERAGLVDVVEREAHAVARLECPADVHIYAVAKTVAEIDVYLVAVIELGGIASASVQFGELAPVPHQTVAHSASQSAYGLGETEIQTVCPSTSGGQFVVPRDVGIERGDS